MRLIFKNLNILRSTLNAISMSFEIKDIVESAGINLPNLFDFSCFGMYWKAGPIIYLYQDESLSPSFGQEVVKNMIRVLSLLGEEQADASRIDLQIEKRKLRLHPLKRESQATLKSHMTLPLAVEGDMIGCISLNSEQPNAFDAQDLQFFSVIGSQMATTIKHFQRFSSIKDIATFDPLTKLYNRRYFEERLALEAKKSFYSGNALSLVMVDIDHFKQVNDTYGHTMGDKVLQEIAHLLKHSLRKQDTVARYGGEEFVLILPESGLEECSMIAERIRRLVENSPIDVGKARLNVTISLGISNFPVHRVKSKEDLVKLADLALYDAKNKGRNRVCIFVPSGKKED